uniref:Ig-like domain-containing protein n=1 Tax=Lates calcarifer TaxID=8187 RepID=A0A4W6CMN9_LATCA
MFTQHSGLQQNLLVQTGKEQRAAAPGIHEFRCQDVTQHPAISWNYDMGSYTMYWYRQNHHGAPVEFLTKEYDQTVGRFQSSLDTAKNNFSLQITELPNDSSTYYCAASHSDENRPDIHTNNNFTVPINVG